MTIQEACQRLGKSESTVRRWIRSGKLRAKRVGRVYDIPQGAITKMVSDQASDQSATDTGVLVEQLRSEVEHLRDQIQIKDKEIDELHQLLMVEKKQAQQLLEYRQPFYKRWFRRRREGEQ